MAARAPQVVRSRSSSRDAERSTPCEDEKVRVFVAPKDGHVFSVGLFRAPGARNLWRVRTTVNFGTCATVPLGSRVRDASLKYCFLVYMVVVSVRRSSGDAVCAHPTHVILIDTYIQMYCMKWHEHTFKVHTKPMK